MSVEQHLVADSSKLLVVTLAAQAQPVFVDLRNDTPFGGRYELETTSPEPEEEGEDDEEEVAKPRSVASRFLYVRPC